RSPRTLRKLRRNVDPSTAVPWTGVGTSFRSGLDLTLPLLCCDEMGAVLPPSPRRLNARLSSWSAQSVRSVAGVFDILICRPVPSLALEGCPLVGRDDTGGTTDPNRPRVSYVDDMRRELELLGDGETRASVREARPP